MPRLTLSSSLSIRCYVRSCCLGNNHHLGNDVSSHEELGLILAFFQAILNQWVKKLESNLFELRSKVGSNIQRAIYFHVVGDRYIITHGFTKKTQKTPEPEKKRARETRDRFLKEENNGNSKSK